MIVDLTSKSSTGNFIYSMTNPILKTLLNP